MNIILTSVGRRSYLVRYFKKAIKNNGKIFVSNSNITFATKEADDYLITPLIYDPDYIAVLLNYCIENKITHVISVFDVDLLVLSQNIDLFKKNNIEILLAPEASVGICNDKWKTYLFFHQNKLNTPKTFLNIEDIIKNIEQGNLNYPIIIKPRWGMASIGIYIADNENELRILANKCKKEIFESYLKYESSFTAEESVIYQELIKGQEYGLDVISDLKGRYVKTFAKKKVSMRAGETDIGETVSSEIFEDSAKIIHNLLSSKVILSVDCFVNKGQIYFIEINCRISGHYPVSHVAGVNLPQQIINWIQEKKTDHNLLTIQEGVRVTKDLVPCRI